ncbi:DUF6583 family protein [Lysinibacillus sp. 54212]|uniref:DUF6583 family protein n=1 Tax=Lysinibacillus sp. 54212 TaxID=3119829 RepID=UPI002FC583D6
MNNPKAKKGIIAVVFACMLLIGGSVTAFFIFNKNPKEQYFYAEYKTMEQSWNSFKERYENEFAWSEKSKTTPTEHEFEVSLSASDAFLDVDPMVTDLVESSSATIVAATDPKKGEAKIDLSVKVMDVTIDDIVAYMTTEKLLLSLPFQDELLQLNDKDYGNLMRTFDPSYIGAENLGLDSLKLENTFLSDEEMEYLQDEYVMGFVKALPDEAFKADGEEQVSVEGEKIKAKKITMTLTEKQVKEVLTTMLEKAKDDKKLKEIILDIVEQAGGEALATLDIDISEEIDVVFEDMIDAVKKELSMPKGLKSTIWVDGDIIVKRDFKTTIEEDELKIEGTQLFKKDKQVWNYKLGDEYNSVVIKGELASKDNKIKDKISLMADDEIGFIYEGKEELDKNTRTFSRVFSIEDGYETVGLNWEGTATHEKDKMSAEHTIGISVEGDEIGINLYQKGKVIKSVDIDEDSKAVNIGEMDQAELEEYLYTELMPNAEQWGMGIFYELGSAFY